MQLVRYIQKRVEPYPWVYNLLILIYSIYAEVKFFFHAVVTGKLFIKFDENRFIGFLSRQEILAYPVKEGNFRTADDLRQWLERKNINFMEGGWTFYLPPQDRLQRYFGSLLGDYPEDIGLKILKDVRHPDEARYTNHKQNPAPGAALKRLLTPTPRALLRVANYLYAHGLGIRVYDLVALEVNDISLTCYVVQNVEGPEVRDKDYDFFINQLKSVLDQGELSTIHEKTDIMWDFHPPNCSDNMIMDAKSGKPLYVDFQGFFLCNENSILERISHEIRDKVHFGGVRFYRGGKKYLYQAIPGLSVGKRDVEARWQYFREMLEECGCSFRHRIVYDIGCNTGLMLYNALSAGALWGMGWDLPEVTESAEKLLLALGATRFDLFGGRLTEDTDFISHVPERFKTRKDGILLFLAVSDHIGFPQGLSELPWEYMFYEGHANQDYNMSLERLQHISWLKKVEIISFRTFADGDTPKRVVILLRRQL